MFPGALSSQVLGLYVLKPLSARALCFQGYRVWGIILESQSLNHKDIHNLRADGCQCKIKLNWEHMTLGTEVRSRHEEYTFRS